MSGERERRLPAARAAVVAAERKVTALRKRTARAEAMLASVDREQDAARARLVSALAHLAWIEAMPEPAPDTVPMGVRERCDNCGGTGETESGRACWDCHPEPGAPDTIPFGLPKIPDAT